MDNIYNDKRIFFNEGNTLEYDFRLKQLKNLKQSIQDNESSIIEALKLDLSKPIFESYTGEIGIVYEELNHAIENLKKWMEIKKVSTPLYLQPSSSYIYPQPKGIVLIISPWNYPFQLAISPLIGAIAAGNCIILKPSNKATNTEQIISKVIKSCFPKEYISVLEGPGSEVIDPLIKSYKFDHIFFTGSIPVGKNIMRLAAEDLTPITLELGGKSPVIVHKDADLDNTAKKITWAKYYNAGQTCISPDYLLVHQSIKEDLILKIKGYILEYYGKEKRDNLSRIINQDRFNRLTELIKQGKIREGGEYDLSFKYISPTILDEINLDDDIMNEEIFGPILPVLDYEDISEVEEIVNLNHYPLALYLFTKDKNLEEYIIQNIRFGGGCINHTLSHLINPNLPFGGVGYSGMGQYHSKYSFDTFSHEKSILKSPGKLEPNFMYPPYTDTNLKIARKFMK